MARPRPLHPHHAVGDAERRRDGGTNLDKHSRKERGIAARAHVPRDLLFADDAAEQVFRRKREEHLLVRLHLREVDEHVRLHDRPGEQELAELRALRPRDLDRLRELGQRQAEPRCDGRDARRLRDDGQGLHARAVADLYASARARRDGGDGRDYLGMRGGGGLRRIGRDEVRLQEDTRAGPHEPPDAAQEIDDLGNRALDVFGRIVDAPCKRYLARLRTRGGGGGMGGLRHGGPA